MIQFNNNTCILKKEKLWVSLEEQFHFGPILRLAFLTIHWIWNVWLTENRYELITFCLYEPWTCPLYLCCIHQIHHDQIYWLSGRWQSLQGVWVAFYRDNQSTRTTRPILVGLISLVGHPYWILHNWVPESHIPFNIISALQATLKFSLTSIYKVFCFQCKTLQ